MDTAFNYHDFTSHTTLARVAGDLLGRFTISTKVGFFPGGEHSLAPERLHQAIEQSVTDLGRTPDLVFLHNPEHTLRFLKPTVAHGLLAKASATLADAVTEGLTDGWGISSWNPKPLIPILQHELPRPDALMVRTGLTVSVGILDAAETTAGLLGLDTGSRWGMAPFAGNTADPIWSCVTPSLFLRPGRRCAPLEAAFAVAYHLPPVTRIAVGADRKDHLARLLAATRLDIDTDTVAAYRALLARRATVAR